MTAKTPATKEQLQERAHLVRIHEANCNIQYPTPDEAKFRAAIMRALGLELGLEAHPLPVETPASQTAAKRTQGAASAQGPAAGARSAR